MGTVESIVRQPSTIEREATVHFNDTISDAPRPEGSPPIYDFDADLTAQVRNTGRFEDDAKFPIGTWPATGDYGAVLLSELRQEQRRILGVYEEHGRTHLPDAQALKGSLGKMVVGVVNLAVRRKEHHDKGQNGDDFFIAELDDNIQIVSQLGFLRGVASRGLVRSLWRVRDDNPVWPAGEQYRSSIASQLRNFPEGLDREELSILPKDDRSALALAYADKYGNGRLEIPAGVEIPEIVSGQRFALLLDGHEVVVTGADNLVDIPEDELGIYGNPADLTHPDGVRYLEISRRVGDPNNPQNSAYAALTHTVMRHGTSQHPNWSEVEIELAA